MRTRFAPSPTGYMHIGNLRTALYCYLIAKHDNGKFILRIEDTDQNREVEGAIDMIYKVMEDTGLGYDEGPDKPGDVGPYIQSERLSLYKEYADKLVDLGAAHYCFCDTETIEASKAEGNEEDGYIDPCKNLTIEEARERIKNGEPYCVRQTIPSTGTTYFDDEIYGRIEVENSGLSEGVLLKTDGYPTYNFANIIDDHLMGITHVVRGNEYLSSTPKYNLIYQAYGWDTPVYIHCPPVMKDEQHKLSKRNGDASYQDLIEKGYLNEAILNYIALLGWSPDGEEELFTLEELKEVFDYKRISKSGAIFDINKLTWMNGMYLRKKSVDEFHELCLPYYKDLDQSYDLHMISELLQPRVEVLTEIPEKIDIFTKPYKFNVDMFNHKRQKTNPENSLEALNWLLPELEALDDYSDVEKITNLMMDIAAKHEVKNGRVMYPATVALTFKSPTPGGASEIAHIIGKENTINRIKDAINKLEEVVNG